MQYAVVFEKTETGYSAHVPDLPGCIAAGVSLEETADLMRKAIQVHLAGMQEDGEPVPEPRTIAEYIAVEEGETVVIARHGRPSAGRKAGFPFGIAREEPLVPRGDEWWRPISDAEAGGKKGPR